MDFVTALPDIAETYRAAARNPEFPGPVRARGEMLAELDLRGALRRWEGGDDSPESERVLQLARKWVELNATNAKKNELLAAIRFAPESLFGGAEGPPQPTDTPPLLDGGGGSLR